MKAPKRIVTPADCQVFDRVAVEVRQSGTSHRVCKMADGGTVVYPCHGRNKPLSPGLQSTLTRAARFYGLLAALVVIAALVILL